MVGPTGDSRTRAFRAVWDVGLFLLVAGFLVVGFWAYLVWGTAVGQHAAQARLATALTKRYATSPAPSPTSPKSTTAPNPSAPNGPFVWPQLGNGDPVARLVIPRIGLDMVVVQGTDTADLREGPGHYPSTPLPGQPGNVAIAGHRTTYAHPFYNLNELSAGDSILVTVPGHAWRYVVRVQMVVAPTDVAVSGPLPEGGSWLTLTTCNPRYSAATRLVVRAQLASVPAATPVPVTVASAAPRPRGTLNRAISTTPTVPASGDGNWWSVAVWAALLVGLGIVLVVAWRATERWPLRLGAGAVAGVLGVLGLWGLFGALAVLLPTGY